tara:strand:+ start:103 stop:390 length:288 start_codon:yes stop_codon:yes gene_type:complete
MIKEKAKYGKKLLKELKQRLEDSWSGATQVIEELDEFQYSAEKDATGDNVLYSERLNNFYNYEIDELKYDAEILQGKIQEAINKFNNKFNLKDEV